MGFAPSRKNIPECRSCDRVLQVGIMRCSKYNAACATYQEYTRILLTVNSTRNPYQIQTALLQLFIKLNTKSLTDVFVDVKPKIKNKTFAMMYKTQTYPWEGTKYP